MSGACPWRHRADNRAAGASREPGFGQDHGSWSEVLAITIPLRVSRRREGNRVMLAAWRTSSTPSVPSLLPIDQTRPGNCIRKLRRDRQYITTGLATGGFPSCKGPIRQGRLESTGRSTHRTLMINAHLALHVPARSRTLHDQRRRSKLLKVLVKWIPAPRIC